MPKSQYPAQKEAAGNPRHGSSGSGEPYAPTREPAGNPGARARGGGEQYPYPAERGDSRGGSAGSGDMPHTRDRSTVASQSAGAGGEGGPREYDPNIGVGDKYMDYAGGDGGEYMNGLPYETDPIVPNLDWQPNYGHSKDVKTIGTLDSDNVDLGGWDSPGTLERGYSVLSQNQEDSPPELPDGEQYPCPDDKSFER